MLSDLFSHMQWADARVWQLAIKLDDRVLRDRLHHIHMVQRAFLAIWNKAEFNYAELSAQREGRELMEWGRTYYAGLATFFGTVDDAKLQELVPLPWAARIAQVAGGDPGPVTLKETMLQVAMHSTYHRGQVNTRLRELGVEPPLVDYIAWLWYRRPAPEWPL
jgi:uncharacterized damage-inducible protein DinB